MKVVPRILLADNISLEESECLKDIKTIAYPENIDVMVYYDTPAGNFVSARIQKNLIDFAKKFNLRFLQGHGIGYYYLDVKEDDILVSCGHQNSIVGAIGASGFHVDEKELKSIIATGEYELNEYSVKHIQVLSGNNLKNACLDFIEKNKNICEDCILECTGSNLSIQNKRDICQILSQCCKCVRFNNQYDSQFDAVLDLSNDEEKIILPQAFINISDLTSTLDKNLDACFIGGCTGGSIEDLRLTASIWKGKKIPLSVRVCIAPSTNEVFLQAIEEGLLEIFIDSGAQILNAGCASCRTTSKGVLGSNEVMLATSIYNDSGCNGEKDSYVYLADTKTVAYSALCGKIVRG